MNLNTLLLTLLVITLGSCGGSREATKTDFTYSLAGIVNGTQMNGGIYLMAKRFDENGNEVEILKVDLDIDDSAEVPFGTWEFYLLGYEGPDQWSGNQYCGSIPLTTLDSDDITLDVTISQSNCGVDPYNSMAADKIDGSVWDGAVWDEATWSP